MKYSRCDELSPRVPRPASSPPLARWRASVCRSSGRLCISTPLLRHRGAPVSQIHPSLRSDVDLLCPLSALMLATGQAFTIRPSTTVAAWQPGPAAPIRGQASIPPVFVSTGSGASVCRDLPGFASACVHPCQENGSSHQFLPNLSASTGPASFVADPDHASPFSRQPDCQKKPPPRLKYQSRSRPDRRHASFRQTPRRRISDNAIYV